MTTIQSDKSDAVAIATAVAKARRLHLADS